MRWQEVGMCGSLRARPDKSLKWTKTGVRVQNSYV
jgi:hypothetical protein